MGMKFATKAVHAGVVPDPSTGAVMTPIFQTSTYIQQWPGRTKGYVYARGANPTRKALEKSIAVLENAKFGLCFSSGMGAADTVIKLLGSGDEVVAGADLYGGTRRMFTKVFERMGIRFRFLNLSDPDRVEKELTDRTRMLWFETPTNPLMRIIDIERYVAIARKRNIRVVVDNTFATPYLQMPLDMGADIVLHSVSKYIGGHSDLIMGALALNDGDLYERLRFIQNSCGPTPSPNDCFLALRGIKTLHLRMERHCANAEKIARFLATHPNVEKVNWPGLPNHYGHELAKRQMKDFGAMLSFMLKDCSAKKVAALLNRLSLFTLAESLGGVESLVSHPATMTHASLAPEERLQNGLTDSLIRLSVGVEDAEDLIADLETALANI